MDEVTPAEVAEEFAAGLAGLHAGTSTEEMVLAEVPAWARQLPAWVGELGEWIRSLPPDGAEQLRRALRLAERIGVFDTLTVVDQSRIVLEADWEPMLIVDIGGRQVRLGGGETADLHDEYVAALGGSIFAGIAEQLRDA